MKKTESRTCKVADCDRTDIKGKGMCNKHYQRWKAHGTTDLLMEYKGPRKDYPSEYRSWEAMKQRCLRETHKYYHLYGGRGVKICEHWLGIHGFANFMEDMGPKPSHKIGKNNRCIYTLDRIDVDGDYCPENCRWATEYQQQNNKRNNVKTPGVNWSAREKRWKARWRVNGRSLCTTHRTYQEAVNQRKKWEQEYAPK